MIKDEAHNFLSCADCKKQLADVVVTRECDTVEFNYVALCPFCNSQSEVKKIKGLVHIGSVEGTRLQDIKPTADKAVIHLRKEA